MATTKTITKKGTYKININSKSKDMTYTISSAKIAKGVHFNMVVDTSKFEYVFEKSGNNLMIYSLSTTGKLITTKITNYYKYYPKNNTIFKVNGTNVITPDLVNVMASNVDYVTGYFNDVNSAKHVFVGRKGSNYYDLITSKDYQEIVVDMGGNDTYNVEPWSSNGSYAIADYAGKDKYYIGGDAIADIHDFKGNDTYDFMWNYAVNVEDNAGNDKYHIFYSYEDINITDKAGNDSYKISANEDAVNITDNKGNDKYTILDNWDPVTIVDKAGNDAYKVACEDYAYITDNKGNDKYNVTYSYGATITDKAGNDKYNVDYTYEYTTIIDEKGKDTYNFGSTYYETSITDYAGADKYTVSDVYEYFYITDGKEGSKAGGNDTYNMSFIYYDTDIYDYYGKDKYNFSYAYDVDIKDYRCSDVYTLKNSYVYIVDYGVAEKVGKKMDKTLANDKYIVTHSDADITDESGNDTYKFTYSYSNGSWSDVYDKKGKDTYILKNTRVDITDLGTSSDMYTISSSSQADISDEGGADTYKVTSSQAWITDNSASKKDSYTVNALNSKVVIKDGGGAGDMLTISSASKGNLIFLADYDANSSAGDGLVHSGSLFIFDKTKGGFIDVQDFFKTGEGNKLAYGADGKATNGTGYIESVKAGKTALNSTISSYITASKLDAWAEAVSGWLNDSAHEYGSIESLVNNGTDADIKNFIAYCTQNGIK